MWVSPLSGTLVACNLGSYLELLVRLFATYALSINMTPLSFGKSAGLIVRLPSCFLKFSALRLVAWRAPFGR